MTTRRLPPTALLQYQAADRDLLRLYSQGGDPDAFAELTRRYGPLAHRAAPDVYPAAVDDAAQATLTLLERKARVLAGRESAAGWVFETARRLDHKARTAAARRRKHEARAAVAEEVARLPDELRAPLVLCYWRGESQSAAAARLGCSLSTLKRRLDFAQDRLSARLSRRGFARAAVLAILTALACQSGRAIAGPMALPIVRARLTAPSGLLKPVFAALAAATAMIAGLALGLAPAGDRPSPPTPRPVEGANGHAAPVDAFGDPLPPGAIARLGTVRFRTADFPNHLAVSPDGKRLVSTAFLQHVRLTIWEADSGRPVREVDLADYPQFEAVSWSPDGRGRAAIKVGLKDYVVWAFTEPNAKPPAGNKSNSVGAGTFSASAFSPDGTLIAGGERAGPQRTAGKLQVWPVYPGRSVREAEPRFTIETADGFVGLVFTADGKRLVGITQGRQPDGASVPSIFI